MKRDIAIRVENLSKQYLIDLGGARHDTLRDQIVDSVASLWRRRSRSQPRRAGFWALRDIDVEIRQGEVVGIIGRNGAGKSTLLKILSRITTPTSGWAEIHGRVRSLLEVGTGFHPELTGGENIYLNGAVLGMKKRQIDAKFDEIVAFAETEKFIHTPVKRYSTGMYLRLAFAVAAHLDPEILIVDEVLAVGDVNFQKKCLGKMQDIAKGGERTILFVSHNMDAVRRLCPRSLLLASGELIASGSTPAIIDRYLNLGGAKTSPNEWVDVSRSPRTGTGTARFAAVRYASPSAAAGFRPHSAGALEFLLAIDADSALSAGSLAVSLYSEAGVKLVNADTVILGQPIKLHPGRNTVRLHIEELHLNPGAYVVGLWLADPIHASRTGGEFDHVQSAFRIEVVESSSRHLGSRPASDGLVTCRFHVSQPAHQVGDSVPAFVASAGQERER